MTRAEWVAQLTARAADAEQLGTLAPLATVLRAVLQEIEQVDGWPVTPPAPDTLVTLEEAARRLAVTSRWLREQRPPYVVMLGDKTLRVSERKLARWLAHQGSPDVDHLTTRGSRS